MWASFNDPHPVLQEGARSLFWIAPMQVDADGAPNAYHRDDPHGSKGLAIEHIGYGMRITKNGKSVPFRPKEEQNAAWLEAYQRIVENGWKAPRGYSVSIYGFAKNGKGEICVTADGKLYRRRSFCSSAMADHATRAVTSTHCSSPASSSPTARRTRKPAPTSISRWRRPLPCAACAAAIS